MISMIVALDENRIIGKNNTLPWNLPADLGYFHKKVFDKTIIIGQKTFELIGKRLSRVKNIILSNDPNFKAPSDCPVADSIEKALELARSTSSGQANDEIMVCGGASVYKQFLPMADRLYLTYIHHNFEGDAYFPEFDIADWKEISREDHQPDEKNKYAYSFVVLERK